MKNSLILVLAGLGFIAALACAYFFNIAPKVQPLAFNPTSNPYAKGIFANGIIESAQANGANVSIYPEISGTVVKIWVKEGDVVKAGAPMVQIDDAVQRASAQQQKKLADGAQTMLAELRAEPRRETLDIAQGQVDVARAMLATATDQFAKLQRSFQLEPKSVSKDALDNANNALKVANANLSVAQKQFVLTRAGAWQYDIRNQENQYAALRQAYEASNALLAKYVLRAPVDGVVIAINAAAGSTLAPQGAYDTYTQAFDPAVVMSGTQEKLDVRVYVDEILIAKLPAAAKMKAQMSIRGTDIKVPLSFVREQPYGHLEKPPTCGMILVIPV
jgi:HlyD family secretion protein